MGKNKKQLDKMLEDPVLKAEIDAEYDDFVASAEDIQEILDVSDVPTIDNPPKPEVPTDDGRGKNDSKTHEKYDIEKKDLTSFLPEETASLDDAEEEDLQAARDNLYTVLGQSMDALSTLTSIAEQSQSPRAFEVVALLSKTITETTSELMNLHNNKVKRDKERVITQVKAGDIGQTPGQGNNFTQNNIFVGTTAELDKVMKDFREKQTQKMIEAKAEILDEDE